MPDGRRVVSAFIATAFAQETPEAASAQWRAVADQIRPKVPKLAAILDDAEPDVLAYIVDLARATRQSPSVKLGVSPRGSTALLASAKAWAWLNGYTGVTPDHVQAMVLPVLRHRIQLRPEAELEGVAVVSILRSIMTQVQVPI